MSTGNKLHDLLDKLYRRASEDEDFTYRPCALRIDMEGWHLLLGSTAAFADGSFDRFEHPDKFKWRGLERILVYQSVEDLKFEDGERAEGEFAIECKALCIETRQAGANGRRKYYDATVEELEAVNE